MEMGTPGAFRDELNALIISGKKTATMAQAEDYVRDGEEPDKFGERMPLLDNLGKPIAMLTITRVDIMRFDDIGDDLAIAEGEGHVDAEHLKRGYKKYWKEGGIPVTGITIVHGVYFSVEVLSD